MSDKNILTPCVIAGITILWLCLVVWDFNTIFPNPIFAIFSFLPLVGGIHLMISVTKERIDEIRSGEEDDLSQY